MLNAGPGKQSGVDIENRFCLLIEKKKHPFRPVVFKVWALTHQYWPHLGCFRPYSRPSEPETL